MRDEVMEFEALKKRVRMSETCIRRWMSLGLFPKCFYLPGNRKRLWNTLEVEAWLKEKAPKIRSEMRLRHFGNHKKKKTWVKFQKGTLA